MTSTKPIYTLMGFGYNYPNTWSTTRVFGFFHTLREARTAVRHNSGEMNECFYKWLLIEKVVPGTFPLCVIMNWYIWNGKNKTWVPAKKNPEFASFGPGISGCPVCNFSVG